MNTSKREVSQATVIIMIWKIIEQQREREQEMTVECLLNEEKLLHLSMMCLQKKTIKAVPFNLSQEIIKFVLKINKITMENFKQQSQNIDLKLMNKAVDLLMVPYIAKYVDTLKSLGNIKIMTFNNLACIYKKKKKFGLAIRAVSYAIQIEEFLFKNDQEKGEKYEIIQTYLNKAAILSEMGKHEKAIQQIIRAKKIVNLIEKQVNCDSTKENNSQPRPKENGESKMDSDEEMKKRMQEKKYYGMYMKMVINYNMGVEKQHLKLNESAAEYYRAGRKLAVAINNPFMTKKFDSILQKISSLR